MKVKELLGALKWMDPEAEVLVAVDWNDTREVSGMRSVRGEYDREAQSLAPLNEAGADLFWVIEALR